MFCPLNELISFNSTDCSFVEITSYYLNPNHYLNLCANVVLQSIITLTANFSSVKFLMDCFFCFWV